MSESQLSWGHPFVKPGGQIVQELDATFRGSRPRDQAPLNPDPRRAWEVQGEGHSHVWTQKELAFDMTATGVKPPDRARSEAVLVVDDDGASNRDCVRIVRGEAHLHGATLDERCGKDYSVLEGNCGTVAWGVMIEGCSQLLHKTSIG